MKLHDIFNSVGDTREKYNKIRRSWAVGNLLGLFRYNHWAQTVFLFIHPFRFILFSKSNNFDIVPGIHSEIKIRRDGECFHSREPKIRVLRRRSQDSWLLWRTSITAN